MKTHTHSIIMSAYPLGRAFMFGLQAQIRMYASVLHLLLLSQLARAMNNRQ